MKSTLDFLRANTDAENSRPGLGPQLGLKIRRGRGGGGGVLRVPPLDPPLVT